MRVNVKMYPVPAVNTVFGIEINGLNLPLPP